MSKELKTEELLIGYLELAEVMFVALDAGGLITYINRKGIEILGPDKDGIVGKNWFDHYIPVRLRSQVKAVFSQLVKGIVEPVEYYENQLLTGSGDERLFAWHNAIVKDEAGAIVSVISSGEDITERKQAEKALKEKAEYLELANDKIQVLSGLLPICMHCKKIRDEEGYWSQVEAYITKHTDTHFSHAICEDCLKRYYPEFDKNPERELQLQGDVPVSTHV